MRVEAGGGLRTFVCLCVCVFMIQRRRALQQLEKIGQTATSEKDRRREEVGRRDGEKRGRGTKKGWRKNTRENKGRNSRKTQKVI